jgi:multicomponent Na+:H+ antiporter subunit F
MILSTVISFVVFPLLAGALILAFLRLLRGPNLADRIVAFDLIAVSSAGIIVVSAITSGQSVLLDAASIWAVIAFLSVIAFAWHIEQKGDL